MKEVKTSENTSTITLSAKRKNVKAVNTTEIKSLDSLMPGTKFDLHVKRVLSNGLYVSFGENYTGYINQLYLDRSSFVHIFEGNGNYRQPTVYFTDCEIWIL